MTSTSYLGIFYCDLCSHGMRQPVWVEGAARLCEEHYESTTGARPPPAIPDAPPRPLPPADVAWQRIVPGLRARARPAGLELQGVRNVKLGGTVEVGDGCGWVLGDAPLVELFLLASEYRDAAEPVKAQVRVMLLRILHGKERP